jgi:hypothetical protein
MPFLLAAMLIPNFLRRTDMLMTGLSVCLRPGGGPAHAIRLSGFGIPTAKAAPYRAKAHGKTFYRGGQPAAPAKHMVQFAENG